MATDEELIKELEKNIQERTMAIVISLIEEKFLYRVDGKRVWKKKEYREVCEFLGCDELVTERLGWN